MIENITDADFNKAMDDLMDYQHEESIKLLSAFKHVLNNIDYPSDKIKEYLRDGESRHVGYCRVFEEEDYKSCSYPGYKFYSVVKEDNQKYHIPNLLMRQDDNKNDKFHCLVWQTCQFEDNYTGYLLFPLTDGTYWAVSFDL